MDVVAADGDDAHPYGSGFHSTHRLLASELEVINEMIGKLTLQYNRARQAAITKELLEIISGAESLKG